MHACLLCEAGECKDACLVATRVIGWFFFRQGSGNPYTGQSGNRERLHRAGSDQIYSRCDGLPRPSFWGLGLYYPVRAHPPASLVEMIVGGGVFHSYGWGSPSRCLGLTQTPGDHGPSPGQGSPLQMKTLTPVRPQRRGLPTLPNEGGLKR